MPSKCAILSCGFWPKSKSDRTSFHSFPKDPDIQKKWISICQKPVNVNCSRICSKHFLDSDYERNLQAELLNYEPYRKKLKKDAVPSVAIPENISFDTDFQVNTSVPAPPKKVNVATNTLKFKCLKCHLQTDEIKTSRRQLKRLSVVINMANSEIKGLKSKISTLLMKNKILLHGRQKKVDAATNTLKLKFECVKCPVHKTVVKSILRKVRRISVSADGANNEISALKSKISSLEIENMRLRELINDSDTSNNETEHVEFSVCPRK